MLSTREKLAILSSLNKSEFAYESIREYFQYLNEPSLFQPILKCITSQLVRIDTQIAAAYDSLSEEEWDDICAVSTSEQVDDELNHKYSDIIAKIRFFSEFYPRFLNLLVRMDINDVFKILVPLFKNKTKNIQFVLFHLASLFPRNVFGFLMSSVRKDPKTYAPFYCSLLARLDMENSLRTRCFTLYFEFVSKMKMAATPNFILSAQYFLYALCYERDAFFFDGVKLWVDTLFSTKLPSLMNRDVVEKFGSLFEPLRFRSQTPDSEESSLGFGSIKQHKQKVKDTSYHCKVFKSHEPFISPYFPFDRPICPSVDQTISNYVEFKN